MKKQTGYFVYSSKLSTDNGCYFEANDSQGKPFKFNEAAESFDKLNPAFTKYNDAQTFTKDVEVNGNSEIKGYRTINTKSINERVKRKMEINRKQR